MSVGSQIGPWAMVPAWVLTKGLKGTELAVYVALRSFADREGAAHPRQSVIADRAGVSLPSVQRAVARLRELGLMTTEEVEAPDGSIAHLNYFMVDIDPAAAMGGPISREGTPQHSRSTPPITGEGRVPSPVMEKEHTSEHTSEHTLGEAEQTAMFDRPTASFEEFWEAYAKKTGKLAARRAWDTALKRKADPDHLVAAAARYAARYGPGKKDKQYQKDPRTWLQQGCYDDEHLPEPVALPRRGIYRAPSGLVMDL